MSWHPPTSTITRGLLIAMLGLGPGYSWSISALQVFNVTDFGALGDGTHDDGPAFQKAIDAAISNHGGTIHFPAGTYLINSAVTDASLATHSIQGTSVNGSTLLIGATGSVTVSAPVVAPYLNGTVRNLTVKCAAGMPGGQVGVRMNDAIGTKWDDVAFSGCGTGLEMQNVQHWTERNEFDNVAFYDCKTAIHFVRQPADSSGSFGYNRFRIWVNTDQPGTIFLASGGAVPYNSSYIVQGNLARGSIIFDAHSDGQANSMYSNTYFIQVEDQGGGSGTSYVFDDHNAGGPNGEINGVAQLSIAQYTQEYAPGSVSIAVVSLDKVPTDLGVVTMSGNSSDAFPNLMLTPNSACFVQPTNAAAAKLTGVWVSSVSWNSVVVSHPSSAGGATFRLWCHP